jgi:hypothetical protein
MVRDRKNNLDNKTDKEYIQEQLKLIKELEDSGRHREAQRVAGELFTWMGWS